MILSIEDHCTVPQQGDMARLLRQVFGAMLVTEPLEPEETLAPSPKMLMGKILLKHRKLPEGSTEESGSTTQPSNDGR